MTSVVASIPTSPPDLDDTQLNEQMQDAVTRDDWDRFGELAAEADRRDQPEQGTEEERRAEQYEALLEGGVGEEEAVERAYGVSVDQQRRDVAIASLRGQGYRGRRFADLARASYKDKIASDYWAAEDATNGYLLSREAETAGIDPRDLWARNETFARRWASDELRAWWDTHGRVTFDEWQAQLLGDVVGARRASNQREDFLS